jgi:transposase-like protein
VHTVIIPNVGSTTLFPIIRARIKPDAVVYSDSLSSTAFQTKQTRVWDV